MNRSIHFYVVRAWFLLNAFISLYPPLYWAASQHSELIPGFPTSLVYFMAVSISITASILYAYWQDTAAGEFTS